MTVQAPSTRTPARHAWMPVFPPRLTVAHASSRNAAISALPRMAARWRQVEPALQVTRPRLSLWHVALSLRSGGWGFGVQGLGA